MDTFSDVFLGFSVFFFKLKSYNMTYLVRPLVQSVKKITNPS